MEELKIEIHGRVQGVRFRDFVKQTADTLGVKGYVMNRDDGSVLVIAQGQKKYLKQFLDRVQKGSTFSKVDGLSYLWENAKNQYEGFVIALDRGTIDDQKRNFINLGKNVLGIKKKVPVHVAIIPDGNRRWAKGKGIEALRGHEQSASENNIEEVFMEAKKLGIKYMTFWGFSTENWNRHKTEVNGLLDLITDTLKRFSIKAKKNKIRFRHLGRKDRLPKKLMKVIEQLEADTKDFTEFNVQLCIDYGGRDEITRAVNKILKSGVKEIKEDDMKHYLDSHEIPDPDLIIRTSGEKRTSGLMPFQSAYAEFYFCDIHFPDFGAKELRKAVKEFGRRGRRFGGN